MNNDEFTEKDYLEAQYKIQRNIQANVTIIAVVIIIHLFITIAVLAFFVF